MFSLQTLSHHQSQIGLVFFLRKYVSFRMSLYVFEHIIKGTVQPHLLEVSITTANT